MHRSLVNRGRGWRSALLGAAVLALVVPAAVEARPRPANDPFYSYAGTKPLAEIAPGTVLATRTVPFHVIGLSTPLKAVQLLYRSTGQTGRPTVNVTSVVRPPFRSGAPKVVSYQSAYDSLNPDDQPSYAIAGGTTPGGAINAAEVALFGQFLLKGYTVAVPDTEGQTANFAAGPEYGMNTLDGLRATFSAPETGLTSTTKAALIGYSGGAIATEWAAELAPEYAPDVDRRLVGAAMGGVLVNPARNLHYIEGSKVWAGVMPMAIVGIARAFEVDLRPYLSPYGAKIYNRMRRASITEVLGFYPGLTWSQIAKPEFKRPEDIPVYVESANALIMGAGSAPTIPLFIGQGAAGEQEGTDGSKPGIGRGDGVMVAGDVRTLARTYCAQGVAVEYREYAHRSHVGALVPWLPSATAWLTRRFGTQPAPENCAQIAPGNSLAPIPDAG